MSETVPVSTRASRRRARLAPSADASALGSAPSGSTGQAPAALRAIGIVKSYRKDRVAIPVLRGVDLHARPGEFLAIIGQSGSGKSTLLHILGTLDAPDAGEIHFDGQRIARKTAACHESAIP